MPSCVPLVLRKGRIHYAVHFHCGSHTGGRGQRQHCVAKAPVAGEDTPCVLDGHICTHEGCAENGTQTCMVHHECFVHLHSIFHESLAGGVPCQVGRASVSLLAFYLLDCFSHMCVYTPAITFLIFGTCILSKLFPC